ncbi:glycoside hydrolase family 26 protein [Microbulbifer sp. ALW1]|uniref:glycoside hydrolase family 26 protein n=1 Tax=Microbulbifer sp. (strain ALW1) TaxID=1516059 RepID=UPI0013589537|nr:glycosyl hydrolase [Microbulbifer sp. ALW1]
MSSADEAAAKNGHRFSAMFVPEEQRQLLFIGQDRKSIDGYVNSGHFPAPGGVTAYIVPIYELRNPDKYFGGMGLDNNLQPTERAADWGGGPANAWKLAKDFPDSALAIGLDINESFRANGLSEIADGKFDAEIDKLAAFIRLAESPVFLRIGYEFDGVWNQGYEKASEYVAAWRHIVDRIRHPGGDQLGPDNVVFVWQGSASPADDAIEGKFEGDIGIWYPGDSYVDWIGLSWFLLIDESGIHPKIPRQQMATQRQLADQILNFARAHSKPVFVAESAPQGYDLKQQFNANINVMIDGPAAENKVAASGEQIWQQWFAPYFDYMHENRDIIRAVAYINCNWDEQPMWGHPYDNGFWGDTRVETNPIIRDYWLQEIQKPHWVHAHKQSLAHSPDQQAAR